MEITRLVELSLIYRLQKELLRSRKKEKPSSADYKMYKLKYNNIQPDDTLTVYVNGSIANKSKYVASHIEGTIVFNPALTSLDVVEVDYSYCPINIYDEGMNPKSKDFIYPAISVFEEGREDTGIELGSNKKEKNSTWIIEVWCSRGGERNDITDVVMRVFEEDSLKIIDYNLGFPTNGDGTRNDSFNESTQTIGNMRVDSINYNKGGSLDIGETPSYITEITVDLSY